MWTAALIAEASTDSPVWQLVTAVIVAVLTVLGGLGTAWFAFRGSRGATDAQREKAFDDRLDAEMSRLRDRCEALVAERDRYRELYANLRIDVIEAGLDPDDLQPGGGRGGTAP